MQDRVALLSQALELCKSLTNILRTLGPKPASDMFRGRSASPRQQQVHSLEDSLNGAFSAVVFDGPVLVRSLTIFWKDRTRTKTGPQAKSKDQTETAVLVRSQDRS